MVGQQSIPQNPQRQPLVGLRHPLQKGGVIAILMKHLSTAISPIEDMVADSPGRRSCGTRHRGINLPKGCCRVKKYNVPFSAFGWLLGVDDETGKLKLVEPIPDTKGPVWYVRYAGKHNGYDAYVLQTLTVKGGRDFQFLGLDPLSGQPRLSSKLDETTQWFVWTLPDLPTEP